MIDWHIPGVARKIWRTVKTTASNCLWKINILGYLYLDNICSLKLIVFHEQISEHFSRQVEAIVYITVILKICFNLSLMSFLKNISPWQSLPSPEYPGKQLHRYVPFVLLHTASALQSCVSEEHSSISDNVYIPVNFVTTKPTLSCIASYCKLSYRVWSYPGYVHWCFEAMSLIPAWRWVLSEMYLFVKG